MAQETPLWQRPDDPGDVGKMPYFDGTTVGWTHVQAVTQMAVYGQGGGVIPTGAGARWYNRLGAGLAIAEWHVSLSGASVNGVVTVEVLMDGAATPVATITVAQGGFVQSNTSQQVVVPNGSYLQARVTAAGSGATDLVLMAKGTLA